MRRKHAEPRMSAADYAIMDLLMIMGADGLSMGEVAMALSMDEEVVEVAIRSLHQRGLVKHRRGVGAEERGARRWSDATATRDGLRRALERAPFSPGLRMIAAGVLAVWSKPDVRGLVDDIARVLLGLPGVGLASALRAEGAHGMSACGGSYGEGEK